MCALAGNVLAGLFCQGLGRLTCGGFIGGLRQRQGASGNRLGHLLRAPVVRLHGRHHGRGRALLQQVLFLQVADDAVRQRDKVFVHTVNTQQAQRGAFYRGGGELAHLIKYLSRNAASARAGTVNLGLIQMQLGHVILSCSIVVSSSMTSTTS